MFLIYDEDYLRQAYIDLGSGRLLGIDDTSDGVMGFIENLHLCALSCEDYAGYLPFLEKPPHILGNEELTVGGLLLAVTGLMLLWRPRDSWSGGRASGASRAASASAGGRAPTPSTTTCTT